jgi:hypothetical protein
MSCPQHPCLETSAAVSCALVRAAITSVVLTNCRSSKIRVHRKAAAGDLGRGSGEHQGDPEGSRVRGLRGDRGIRRQASARHYATTLRACAGGRTSRSRTPPPRNGVRRPRARRSRAATARAGGPRGLRRSGERRFGLASFSKLPRLPERGEKNGISLRGER